MELKPQIEKLNKYHVKVILSPTSETSSLTNYHPDEATFNINMSKYIKNIETTNVLCGSNSFTAIKLTTLIRPILLEQFNDFCCLNIEKKNFNEILNMLHSTNFTLNEIGEINNLLLRLNMIIKTTEANDMRIFIDAEQSYFQTAINKIVIYLQSIFNKNRLLVYNTYQCYKKDTLDMLQEDLQQSKIEQFHIGFKLVRGGYMVQERKRAKEIGYEDPIHANFDDTSECYKKALTTAIEYAKSASEVDRIVRVFLASHNEDTVRFAVEIMKNLNIKPEDELVSFATLFVFLIAEVNSNAYKLMPYGPLDSFLPYLARRAQDNRSIFKKRIYC